MLNITLFVGFAKAGTSVTAQIFAAHGGFGGSGLSCGMTPENPQGKFENIEFEAQFKSYCRRNISGELFFNLGNIVPWKNEFHLPPATGLREKTLEIFNGQGWDGKQALFFKYPAMVFLLRIWIEQFPEAKVVVIRRNPTSVFNSIANIERSHSITGSISHAQESRLRMWVKAQDVACNAVEKNLENTTVLWPEKFIRNDDWTEMQYVIEQAGLTFDRNSAKAIANRDLWTEGKRLLK